MATIVTLRPSATSSSTGWTAVPSGTLHSVTSDNNDATYALWSGNGAPLVLQTPIDSPGAGLRRHQVRVRARGQLGDAWWGVRLQSGLLTAGAARQFPASLETSIGSWGFGAPPDGATILAAHIEGQSDNLRIAEIFLDVDFRGEPQFAAEVLDGAGDLAFTVTDTSTPTLHADSIDLDGLPARQFRYWVTQGVTVVFDTGIVSGQATDTQTTPLANGSYTAHMQIWSTLGGQYEYPSAEETYSFSVSIGEVPKPADPVVTQIPDSPLWEIGVCAPDVRSLDGDVGYIEIQRVGCVTSEDPTAVTIAMLGPLETDECTSYIDYSVPRTGLPATAACDHPDEQCCSYYRARTIGRIGGNVVISTWSDVTESGLSSGLVFFWPSTHAAIPDGWSRVAGLDDRYAKGAPDGVQPGTSGGAATHTHTVPPHSHDVSHSHTMTGPTSAAVGTVASTPNSAGSVNVLATHTHTVPANTGTTTMSTDTTTPPIGENQNDPDLLRVIHIASDGTPAGIPDGALGITSATTITGWTDYANATGRYLKGAFGPDGDAGATAAGTMGNHTHGIGVHSHTVPAHTHTGGTTGTASSTIAAQTAGANSVVNSATHAHPITVNSASAATPGGGGSGSGATSAGTQEPPFINLRVKQNTSGAESIPVGIIGLWQGSLGTIPDHFALCDGTNGTPDLRARYPKGATSSIGTTGGGLTAHTHTSASHGHTTNSHSHTVTIGAQNAATATATTAAAVTVSSGTHTHTLAAGTGGATPTAAASTSGTLASTTDEPLHTEVAFVQLIEPFAPEPEPEVLCLTWDESEHLIRTTGPDGPMWAAITGFFDWERDRPFSSAIGVEGERFAVNAPPGERNHRLTAAFESEADADQLRAILRRPLVLISPSDSTEVWAAPIAASITDVKVGRVRQISAEFIGTGPQPGPQIADI
jgi:hypothetical protein